MTRRWRIAHDRWHTGIVDAVGTAGLLAHVEGRTSKAVTGWLEAQPQAWRDQVTHVTIDLSASYAKAVRAGLPDAVIVADRYHLAALGNGMLTDVRHRVTREDTGHRGRAIDPAWASRRRLVTGFENLSPEAFTKMWNGLIDTGAPGIEILHAFTVNEDLRALLALAGTNPSRAEIAHHLERFYRRAASCPAPEAHRLAETIEAWWPAIEAAITTGYSNARSEGYNRLAKHVRRNAFGFRNVDNHRQRIRWACTRQHRRATAKEHPVARSSSKRYKPTTRASLARSPAVSVTTCSLGLGITTTPPDQGINREQPTSNTNYISGDTLLGGHRPTPPRTNMTHGSVIRGITESQPGRWMTGRPRLRSRTHHRERWTAKHGPNPLDGRVPQPDRGARGLARHPIPSSPLFRPLRPPLALGAALSWSLPLRPNVLRTAPGVSDSTAAPHP